MNKIMELARAVCQAYHGWHQDGNSDFKGSEYADLEQARAALRAEVTRTGEREAFHQRQRDMNITAYAAMTKERDGLRAELADYKQRYLDCTAQTARAEDRAEAAEAKLAALEAQEPVARVTACDMNAIYWLAPTHGATFNTPFYLAAGAKEKP